MARKSLLARIIQGAILSWFKRQGWQVEGAAPFPRKFIVIAAPHTSNWDFVHFLGAADGLNLDLSFMGKKSLFRWPFARAMKDMGGVPVDRSSSQNYVQQMIEEFGKRAEFMLTIAPEGTRRRVEQWKTGFYHIAVGAKVPIVCGMMDYKRKVVGLGPTIWPTGDYDKDMVEVFRYYSSVTPKHPQMSSSGAQAYGPT